MVYNILIQPLVLIIDILFSFFCKYFGIPGDAIIFLSITVNLMALPLYRQAERIQKTEQLKQNSMKPWVNHIKKTFSGDEQYMMLSAYYRIEHYSPVSMLKESFPLLLQIPIFIAAYRYLSNSSLLLGATFGPIPDLGAPDGLLTINGLRINLLPILMTALNLFSGLIYTRNHGLRMKIQVFGLAVIFLLLLYNSPSGLVLYWTISQVFSVIKNLIMETKVFRTRKVLLPLSISVIFIALICTATSIIRTRFSFVVSEFFLFLAVIYIFHVILQEKNISLPKISKIVRIIPKICYPLFFLEGTCMFLLFGFCIPSSVLSASASEFVETVSGNFQWYLLTYPATVYAGLFLLWTSIYYYFTSGRERIFLFGFMLIVLGVSLINYFIFDVKPEFYYTDLSFDGDLVITGTSMLLNLVAALVTVMILFVLWLKKQEVLKNASLVVAVSLLILGVNNTVQIPKALKNVTGVQKPGIKNEIEDYTGSLHLSKNKKNVVILMLDRAIGSQVPFIFDELPKLKDDFDGFVYYPNTISYAKHTILGAPPLYGGYEYTPKILAENAEGNDWEKRAEAMRVLPVLFSDNGFDSTVCDPAFYGLSNYKDYPKIKTFKLVGHFNGKYEGIFDSGSIPVQMRNFLIFSIYKTAPLFMKDAIYDTGKYMTPDGGNTGLTQAFIDNYTALMELPNLTSALDSDEGSFIFLQNSTTHEPSSFDPPEYEVKPDAGNKPVYGERMVGERNMKIEDYSSWKHYCVNVVSYKELTKWFGAMKKLGVYDNTRIILAADHGAELGQFDDLMFSDGCDAESVNPLLMVKDFGAKGPLTTSDELMTNADVPVLATEGIIENAANPFTGVPINSVEKENGTLWVECGVKRQRTSEEDNLSVDDIIWWTVHDNIFDRNNWTVID